MAILLPHRFIASLINRIATGYIVRGGITANKLELGYRKSEELGEKQPLSLFQHKPSPSLPSSEPASDPIIKIL